HYPAAVTRVLAVEPSDVAWARSQGRRDSSPVRVVRAGLDGERLDLPDASVDCALSTFTLCTIPDAVAALREVARVLRPGGRLHFVEHGLSPDPGVARWQHRLTPVQRRLGGGCHLDRPVLDLMREAGLVVEDVATFYAARPRAAAYVYAGRAASTR
ncbi:MAG: class I SAM-dependent methyltransferase, partial [Nocardioides sp.]